MTGKIFLGTLMALGGPYGSAAPAYAGTSSTMLDVSAVVVPTCDIGGSPSGALPGGVGDFGRRANLDVVGLRDIELTMTTELTIRCSGGATPLVRLDYGRNAVGAQRALRGPAGSRIPYDLRQGSAGAAPWDDQPHPVAILPGKPSEIPIYGVIPRLDAGLTDGHYTDKIIVTVEY